MHQFDSISIAVIDGYKLLNLHHVWLFFIEMNLTNQYSVILNSSLQYLIFGGDRRLVVCKLCGWRSLACMWCGVFIEKPCETMQLQLHQQECTSSSMNNLVASVFNFFSSFVLYEKVLQTQLLVKKTSEVLLSSKMTLELQFLYLKV